MKPYTSRILFPLKLLLINSLYLYAYLFIKHEKILFIMRYSSCSKSRYLLNVFFLYCCACQYFLTIFVSWNYLYSLGSQKHVHNLLKTICNDMIVYRCIYMHIAYMYMYDINLTSKKQTEESILPICKQTDTAQVKL